ncbi:MAG: GPR endopeptidase [Ruminococcus sp.]|nr:GPR endopeptidase [Ruminococcus sp.]
MDLRTDLAVEAREIAGENISGVEFEQYSENGLDISRLRVKTRKAQQLLGKEEGTYITVELPSLTDNFTETDERLVTIGQEIRRLLPVNGLVLVAGLGNPEITPDSLGPKTSARVLATRHITGEIAKSTGLDKLRPVAVMSTGVTGQTGIETGEYILSIVKRIRPNAVVVVDALASRRLERLGCTLQISDTGISPGAGVGNHRTRINKETIGVPVIAIGVPTVVDASTLASDLLKGDCNNKTKKMIAPNGRQMVVIPREIDLLTERAARLISFALNGALHNEFTIAQLASLM